MTSTTIARTTDKDATWIKGITLERTEAQCWTQEDSYTLHIRWFRADDFVEDHSREMTIPLKSKSEGLVWLEYCYNGELEMAD